MRLSHNELYHLCRKALWGAGAPAGSETDGAYAATWLAARGLPGPELLAEALQADLGAPQLLAPGRLACAGASAAVHGGVLLDLAVAEAHAAPSGCAGLHAAELRHPLLLLPLGVRRAEAGYVLRLAWPGAELLAGAEAAALFGSPAALQPGITDVAVEVAVPGRALPSRAASLPLLLSGEALEQRYRQSLADGIEPEPGAALRLERLARLTYVPATVESRARGAGAGAIDNE